jgi:hypothetical protein
MDPNVDEVLRRRYWLKENLEWFIGEVMFHKEMKGFFAKDNKKKLWSYGDPTGKVKIYDEITE